MVRVASGGGSVRRDSVTLYRMGLPTLERTIPSNSTLRDFFNQEGISLSPEDSVFVNGDPHNQDAILEDGDVIHITQKHAGGIV